VLQPESAFVLLRFFEGGRRSTMGSHSLIPTIMPSFGKLYVYVIITSASCDPLHQHHVTHFGMCHTSQMLSNAEANPKWDNLAYITCWLREHQPFFFFSLTSGKSLDYFNTKFIFTTGHGNPSWSLQ
jgi:hypothetical protein